MTESRAPQWGATRSGTHGCRSHGGVSFLLALRQGQSRGRSPGNKLPSASLGRRGRAPLPRPGPRPRPCGSGQEAGWRPPCPHTVLLGVRPPRLQEPPGPRVLCGQAFPGRGAPSKGSPSPCTHLESAAAQTMPGLHVVLLCLPLPSGTVPVKATLCRCHRLNRTGTSGFLLASTVCSDTDGTSVGLGRAPWLLSEGCVTVLSRLFSPLLEGESINNTSYQYQFVPFLILHGRQVQDTDLRGWNTRHVLQVLLAHAPQPNPAGAGG